MKTPTFGNPYFRAVAEANMPVKEATHDDPVVAWKIEQFNKQGFNPRQVIELIDADVSHHDTEDLINRGCSHELALQILCD